MSRTPITQELASGLPEYYPIAEDTGNYKLLEPPALQIDLDDITIEEMGLALNPTNQMAPDMVIERDTELVVREGDRLYRRSVTVVGDLIVYGELYTNGIDVEPSGSITNHGSISVESELEEFLLRLEKMARLVDITPQESETIEEYRARVLAEFAVMTCEGTANDIISGAAQILDIPQTAVDFERRTGPGESSITVPSNAVRESSLDEAYLTDRLERLMAASYSLSTLSSGSFTYITPSQYDSDFHDAELGYDGLDANDEPKDNGGTYAGVID